MSVKQKQAYEKFLNTCFSFLPKEQRENLVQEIPRKQLHLTGSFSTIVLKYTTYKFHKTAGIIASSIGIFFLFVGLIRLHSEKLNNFIWKYFSQLLRPQEKTQLTGTYAIFLGSGLTVLVSQYFFPDQYLEIATYAYISLFFGDAAASLVGRTFGKHKIGYKSLEGSIANFTVNLISSRNIFVALASSLTELACGQIIKIDDNLIIPLSSILYYSTYLKIKSAYL